MKYSVAPSPSVIEMQSLSSSLESLRCAAELLRRTRKLARDKNDKKTITSTLRILDILDESFRIRYLALRDKAQKVSVK